MKLLKCMKTTFLAEGLPLHQQNSFFLVLRNSASIYNLYACCIGPDTYSLTDLFLLYATLFSPPEFLNFVSHTWPHFRKPCMCSSLTNNPRSPIATSNLSKSNWDKKATFKKKKYWTVLQNISWYWKTIIYTINFFNKTLAQF